MTKASPVPAGTAWWTACEAFTWVAFGEARKLRWWDKDGNERWTESIEFPASEWTVDWKQPPRTGLSRAFITLATGRRWTPEEWGSRGRAHYLGWAWAIMRDTEAIIRDPERSAERLGALLTEHNEQHERNQNKLRQAWREVMTAVREGRLTIRARRALPNGRPDIDALYEMLAPAEVFGTHSINLRGKVDYAGSNGDQAMTTTSLETLFDYKGPRWDEAEFVASQVQALWPANPSIAAVKVTAAGENRLQVWLEAAMGASPNASPGKFVVQAQAEAAGYVFSGAGFDRAWAAAVRATGAVAWSAAGAKRKSERA